MYILFIIYFKDTNKTFVGYNVQFVIDICKLLTIFYDLNWNRACGFVDHEVVLEYIYIYTQYSTNKIINFVNINTCQ